VTTRDAFICWICGNLINISLFLSEVEFRHEKRSSLDFFERECSFSEAFHGNWQYISLLITPQATLHSSHSYQKSSSSNFGGDKIVIGGFEGDQPKAGVMSRPAIARVQLPTKWQTICGPCGEAMTFMLEYSRQQDPRESDDRSDWISQIDLNILRTQLLSPQVKPFDT
jgi:hypothetical protein